MQDTKTASRRRPHSAQFKAQVLAACAVPGASIASVALAYGLNANLVHTWRRRARRRSGSALEASMTPTPVGAAGVKRPAEFIALPLATPPAAAAGDIRIELRRGGTSVAVHWPVSAAAECAGWLREWLRG